MFQKLYRHLEEINANTKHQQAQLEQLNESITALHNSILSLQKPQPPRRTLQTAGLIVAGLGLITIAILALYTFRLSTITTAASYRSSASLKAYGLVNTRCDELSGSAHYLEERTGRLDSLVRQQAQTILELKKLNATAIRTILYLQRDYNERQVSLLNQ